jgi:hypothetical protein
MRVIPDVEAVAVIVGQRAIWADSLVDVVSSDLLQNVWRHWFTLFPNTVVGV